MLLRRDSQLIAERIKALHLLFVCTGNICRSPTAERLSVAYGAEWGINELHVSSAGTRAVVGHEMQHDAALVLQSLGGDSSSFSARQLTPRLAADADLIIAMTKTHRNRVLEVAPQRLHTTFTLTEAFKLITVMGATNVRELAGLRPSLDSTDLWDIPDPIGKSRDLFVAVGSQIAELLPPIIQICAVDTDEGYVS